MKQYILAVLVLSLTSFTVVKGQNPDSGKVTYGIRVGVNRNSTTRSSSMEENRAPEMKGFQSYSVEVVVDIPLLSVLSLQSGLELTRKGQEKKVCNSEDNEQYRVTYLQMPVNLVYKYKNFFAGAGGYAAAALGGKYESESVSKDLSLGGKYVSANSKQNDDWEKFDYGLKGILGYKFRKFSISLNYERGLKDVDPSPYYKSMNRVGSLELGYTF